MKKRLVLILWLGIFASLYSVTAQAQFYPFYPYPGAASLYSGLFSGAANPYSGATSPLLSTSYLSLYLNPYYYNTSVPISSFGQFDPSISLDNVTLSPETLYSPTQYRTYDPGSLQGLYQFSPAPFNYLWNSMVASQDSTVNVNPYFATPFYYPLLNKGSFSDNPAERTVPLSLYALYNFAPHLPELFYTATQAGLAPQQNFLNALSLSLSPVI